MFKVVTWNVNSVAVRLNRLLSLLEREKPDFVLLQELKCIEEKFPFEAIKEAGYLSTAMGQKTYNGVAILSKEPPQEVTKGIDAFYQDPAARLIKARYGDTSIICCYVPNGQEVGSEKYRYKLAWLNGFKDLIRVELKTQKHLIIGGDFNIAPEDRDVHDPEAWKGKILCSSPERDMFFDLLNLGLTDTFRLHHQEKGLFSWWDYRALGFQKNQGLRIDFILASNSLAQKCIVSSIDKEERKGEKPSDHAPVIAQFSSPI